MISSRRELEKQRQQEQLKKLIAIVVSTITNYIDFKESYFGKKAIDLIMKPMFFENILRKMETLVFYT